MILLLECLKYGKNLKLLGGEILTETASASVKLDFQTELMPGEKYEYDPLTFGYLTCL